MRTNARLRSVLKIERSPSTFLLWNAPETSDNEPDPDSFRQEASTVYVRRRPYEAKFFNVPVESGFHVLKIDRI